MLEWKKLWFGKLKDVFPLIGTCWRWWCHQKCDNLVYFNDAIYEAIILQITYYVKLKNQLYIDFFPNFKK